MFDYIKGTLTCARQDKVVVDVGGIGYSILIPFNAFFHLPSPGEEVFFYIASVIREDSHRNFGFLNMEERDLFEKVSAVSGIGPKTALSLIGHLERKTLEMALHSGDSALLTKIPGIGKKTAERLIIELRDKITSSKINKISESPSGHPTHDAIRALMHLGYRAAQAERAVQQALKSCDQHVQLDALITAALRSI